ncbi:MAG TPA: metalloregulator ArsR/SmtB family transcription factor [Deltaproteobacteria bacterium]|nr:metalloregulator ArsR/SmtB family transcription factor [Deltaproteobacteria bacterium]
MSRKENKGTGPEVCQVRMVHQDRVDKARSEALERKELEALSRFFKALGDPTRLAIAMALQTGEMCVCDLAAFTGISESAVSHQLRHMKDLALVKSRRDAQILYYSLDDNHIAELIQTGLDHIRE